MKQLKKFNEETYLWGKCKHWRFSQKISRGISRNTFNEI